MTLTEKLHERESEVSARDDDLRQIIGRHEQEIQRLASKGDLNIQDEVLKMMEQKVKDVNEILAGKVKVIELLQGDLTSKEKSLIEKTSQMKTMSEKLESALQEMKQLQSRLRNSEQTWKQERENYEAKIHELANSQSDASQSAAYIQQLQASVKQYETAYQQISQQYTSLHEQYTKLAVDKESVQKLSPPESQQSSESVDIEKLKQELANKDERIRELESIVAKSAGSAAEGTSGGAVSKVDAKFMKYKAQATAKIKTLEKKIEELNQVRRFETVAITPKSVCFSVC